MLAALQGCFLIIDTVQQNGGVFPFLPLLLSSGVSYVCNRLLLRRARPLPLLVGCNVLLLAGGLLLLFTQGAQGGFIAVLYMAGCAIALQVISCLSCIQPIRTVRATTLMEMFTLVLIFVLLLLDLGRIELQACLPMLLMAPCAFLGLLLRRLTGGAKSSEYGKGLKTGGVILLTLAIAAVLVLIFFALLADPLGQGLIASMQGMGQLAGAAADVMLSVLRFIVELFPPPEVEIAISPMDPPPASAETVVPGEVHTPAWLLPAVLIIAGVLLVGGAAALLVYLRHQKVQVAAGGEELVEKGAWQTFRRGIVRMRQQLRLKVLLWQHRDSSLGVLWYLQKKGRRLGAGRAEGETVRCFLQRLSAFCADTDAAFAESLLALADRMDLALYRDSDSLLEPMAEAGRFRRAAKRCLKRK